MRKSLLHSIVALLIAVIVPDYAVIQLLQDEKPLMEVEADSDLENLSEKEKDPSGLDLDSSLAGILSNSSSTSLRNSFAVLSGKTGINLNSTGEDRLFILYHQLKLHC